MNYPLIADNLEVSKVEKLEGQEVHGFPSLCLWGTLFPGPNGETQVPLELERSGSSETWKDPACASSCWG